MKQAWKNYFREGNVSTLRWDCEDTEEVVIQRLQQLSCDLEHYVYLCSPDTFHEVYIYLETNDSEFQKEPHYTALYSTCGSTGSMCQQNYIVLDPGELQMYVDSCNRSWYLRLRGIP